MIMKEVEKTMELLDFIIERRARTNESTNATDDMIHLGRIAIVENWAKSMKKLVFESVNFDNVEETYENLKDSLDIEFDTQKVD